LLDVFSKDDLHHLYPELFEIATLSLPCLWQWHHVSAHMHTARSK
jgi:hypothetical protein